MRQVFILVLIGALLCAHDVLRAQPQQSEHFRIAKSVLDAGGASSTSAHFNVMSAFGQPSPLGIQTSSHFSMSGGFLSSTIGVSPLSPIQALVILQSLPDVKLYWPRVNGAGSYKIYRDTVVVFTPSASNLIGTATDTLFTDLNVIALPKAKYFYIVTALNGSSTLIASPPEVKDSAPATDKAASHVPSAPTNRSATGKK